MDQTVLGIYILVAGFYVSRLNWETANHFKGVDASFGGPFVVFIGILFTWTSWWSGIVSVTGEQSPPPHSIPSKP